MCARVSLTVRKKKEERRIGELLNRLDGEYPNVECALHHVNPYQLLVATILSAQCTDKRVNIVTPALFKKYPNPWKLAAADKLHLQEIIHSTGFFRNKAKNLIGAARRMVQDFSGCVPRTMEDLLKLDGVARKTANVVLGTAFAISCGVVVDTHVKRLSNRLGLSSQKDPNRIERDLMSRVPQDRWIAFSHQLIHHGRRVCGARKPKCAECVLADLCPYRLEISGH